MKKKIYIEIGLLLLGTALVWVIFSYLPIFKSAPSITIPVATEEKIGKTLAEELMKDNPGFHRIESKFDDSCMNVIRTRLLKSIGYSEYEYKIYLVKNSQVNAVSLPGGYIFVFSGLADFCESPEELAGVLAHEIGHIEHKHLIKKLLKEFGLAMLTGGDRTAAGSIARLATGNMFDRTQEEDADDFALETMKKAKINPQLFGILFSRLEEKYRTDNTLNMLLSTHPNNSARIKKALNYNPGTNFSSLPFDMDWAKFIKEMGEGEEE